MTAPDEDRPFAVLLDLDGTLVDTVDVWRVAYLALATELDVELAPDFWASIAGRSMQDSLTVFGRSDVDATTSIRRLVDLATLRVTEAEGPGVTPAWRWLPGAQELLLALRAADVSTALVTSAWRSFLTSLQRVDGGLAVSLAVCGDEVEHGKPAPDSYLRAAEALDVAPEDCLVIEDSPTGVAAAEAAGMVVLAVPHAGVVVPAPGREVRDSLVGLTVRDLERTAVRLRSERFGSRG
jgi:beta-phosphoglucomutase-like phosphatase (HAD superfamily)